MSQIIYWCFILCKILEGGSHDALTILSTFWFEFLECRKNQKCYFWCWCNITDFRDRERAKGALMQVIKLLTRRLANNFFEFFCSHPLFMTVSSSATCDGAGMVSISFADFRSAQVVSRGKEASWTTGNGPMVFRSMKQTFPINGTATIGLMAIGFRRVKQTILTGWSKVRTPDMIQILVFWALFVDAEFLTKNKIKFQRKHIYMRRWEREETCPAPEHGTHDGRTRNRIFFQMENLKANG